MSERGFVLVNVLVLVAALSVVALGLTRVGARAVERLEAAGAAGRGTLMLDAGAVFAADLVARDGGGTDHRGEPWALEGYRAETATGPVTLTVTDLESRLNLNLLARPGAAVDLLGALALAVGAPPDAAEAIVDRYDALAAAAALADPATDAAFRAGDLTHPAAYATELPALAAPEAQALRAVVWVLPRARGLNVNTADAAILGALPGMDAHRAAAVLAVRRTRPFADVGAFWRSAGLDPTSGMGAVLGVTSDWFLVATRADVGGLTFRGETILHRDARTGTVRRFAHAVTVEG